MIELHRAEARLQAAEATPITPVPAQDRWLSFAELCRQLEREELPTNVGGPTQIETLRAKWFRTGDGFKEALPRLRRAQSLAADGIRFLNRAGPA